MLSLNFRESSAKVSFFWKGLTKSRLFKKGLIGIFSILEEKDSAKGLSGRSGLAKVSAPMKSACSNKAESTIAAARSRAMALHSSVFLFLYKIFLASISSKAALDKGISLTGSAADDHNVKLNKPTKQIKTMDIPAFIFASFLLFSMLLLPSESCFLWVEFQDL